MDEVVRVVAAGVDTLYIAYRGHVGRTMVRDLERAKAAAGEERKAPKDPRTGEPLRDDRPAPTVELAGLSLEMRPYGGGGTPYLLVNLDVQVAVTPSSSTMPTVQVRLSSRALWRAGASRCVGLADRIAQALLLDGWTDRWVQRLDLAVDHQLGTEPRVSWLERFSKRGGLTAMTFSDNEPVEETLAPADFWVRYRLTGFRFGRGGAVVVRWYDKSAEIKVSEKLWFRDIWQASGYEPDFSVWRLELQVRREFLASAPQLDTVEAVLAHVGDIWRKVVHERLRLTDGRNVRLDRADTDPVWETLATTSELDGVDGADGRVTLERQAACEAEALVPAIRGYLASYGAAIGASDWDTGALEALEACGRLSDAQGQSLDRLLKEKATRRAVLASNTKPRRARRAMEQTR